MATVYTCVGGPTRRQTLRPFIHLVGSQQRRERARRENKRSAGTVSLEGRGVQLLREIRVSQLPVWTNNRPSHVDMFQNLATHWASHASNFCSSSDNGILSLALAVRTPLCGPGRLCLTLTAYLQIYL